MGHKLNSELVEWIKAHSASVRRATRRQNAVVYRSTKWRLRDRLTEVDMVRLVMAFQTGIATKELAEHFGIYVKSVRKLLREHGLHKLRGRIARWH